MKLRKAYFCKMCNEEVDIKINKINGVVRRCPHCGYKSRWGITIVYEWKVEVKDKSFYEDFLICFNSREVKKQCFRRRFD